MDNGIFLLKKKKWNIILAKRRFNHEKTIHHVGADQLLALECRTDHYRAEPETAGGNRDRGETDEIRSILGI